MSKKMLLALGLGMGVTTIGVGTAVGIVTTNRNKTELGTTNAASSLINQLDEKAIVIKAINNQSDSVLIRENTYSFNVKAEQLDLIKTQKDLFTQNYNISFHIDIAKNQANVVNKGELNIEIKLESKLDKANDSSTRTLLLKGFKQANKDLYNLFDQNESEIDENYYLTINPKSSSNDKYTKLEHLNMQMSDHDQTHSSNNSNLTKWFRNGTNGNESLSIEGKVKLEKVTKNNEKTYFYLVSNDNNKYLKLTRNEGELKEEIVIGKIKTTNLLASQISIKPIEINNEETTKLFSALDGVHATNKKYKNNNDQTFSLDIDTTTSNPNWINISPFVINALTKEQSNVPIQLSISYGIGSDAKTYDSSNANDLIELNEAGVNIQLFSKKLDGTKEVTKSIVETCNKLGEYFKQDNYTKPNIAKPECKMKNGSDNGEYYVTSLNKADSTSISIDLKKSGKTEITPPANLIVFASYSYQGIEENKALLTPSLTLIHVPKTNN